MQGEDNRTAEGTNSNRHLGRWLKTVLTVFVLAGSVVVGAWGAQALTQKTLSGYLVNTDPEVAYDLESRVQTLTAQCMASQGFEYVEHVPQPDPALLKKLESPISAFWLSPDFAEESGYGLTAQYIAIRAHQQEDPNRQIIGSLTPIQKTEYLTTLYGRGVGSHQHDEQGHDLTGPTATDGCRTQAELEVYGELWTALEALSDVLNQHYLDLLDDERIRQAAQSWSSCMYALGNYEFDTPIDARNAVMDRITSIGVEPSESANTRLASLLRYERDLATADMSCQADGGNIFREVEKEHETQFVNTHRVALEAIRDARTGN